VKPVVRLLGRILRLVGISSPEDAAARKKAAPPSWKTTAQPGKTGENGPDKPKQSPPVQ
jgi:hypothetical protein